MKLGLNLRKHVTAGLLLAVVAGMVGLAFASVPLYRLLCRAVGLGGATQIAKAVPDTTSNEVFTIAFDANTDKELPWEFKPNQKTVQVKAGEPITITYHAKNLTDYVTKGQATYNVTPEKVGIYFDKLQCFCFDAQTLQPHEEADMAVQFFVDPAILKDNTTDEVRTITLSYTFFRSLNGPEASKKTASADVPVTRKTN